MFVNNTLLTTAIPEQIINESIKGVPAVIEEAILPRTFVRVRLSQRRTRRTLTRVCKSTTSSNSA